MHGDHPSHAAGKIEQAAAIGVDGGGLVRQRARRCGTKRNDYARPQDDELLIKPQRRASISDVSGFLWIRRLMRGSFLKCFTALVM